jgi:hypothetical protein
VSPDSVFYNPLLAPNNPLETLLLDLRLSCSDDCRRVRVAESTSRLAILVAGTDVLGTCGVGGDLSEGGGCDWADVSALNG